MRFVFLTLFLTAALAVAENSESPQEQVKRLLRSALEESKKAPDYGTPILLHQLEAMEGRGPVVISVIGPMRKDPSEYSLTATIDTIEILSRSPKIQADCRALRPKLRAEMEARDAELAANIRQGVMQAWRETLEARSVREIEAPGATLEKLWLEGRTRGEEKSFAAAESARQHGPFSWQILRDVLASGKSPTRRQWNQLDDLGTSALGGMPRSESLERFARFLSNNQFPRRTDFLPEFHAKLLHLVRSISTPADLAKGLQQLDALYSWDGYEAQSDGSPIAEVIAILKGYQQIYLDLTHGRATKIDVTHTPLVTSQLFPAFLLPEPPREPLTSNRADVGVELSRLRGQLVLLALPRTLGLSESAGATETVPDYLGRIGSQAGQKADWPLLLRVLEAKRTLHVGVAPEAIDTIGALRAFLSGLHQEQAKDYVAAGRSFQAVLRTGSQFPPAELVGSHLERLRNKHPREFQEAMIEPENLAKDSEPDQYRALYLPNQPDMPRYTLPPPPAPAVLRVPAGARVK